MNQQIPTGLLPEQFEKYSICSEHSHQRAQFICDRESCPFYEKQKLYCPECNVKKRHDHGVTRIHDLIDEIATVWQKVFKETTGVLQGAQAKFGYYKPSILFFEEVSKKHNITLARSIKADYDEFENLYSQLY